MKLLALALLSIGLSAQTLTLTGPATATPGSSVTVSVTLAGSSGLSLAGLQWSAAPLTSWQGGAAATAAGKTLWCGTGACMVIGSTTAGVLSNQVMADGVVGTGIISVPSTAAVGSTLAIPLTALSAVNVNGGNVAITSGAAYSITVAAPVTPPASACDVNSDGVVNGLDVIAVINSIPGVSQKSPLPACPTSFGCTLQTAESIIHAVPTSLGGDGATCPLGH